MELRNARASFSALAMKLVACCFIAALQLAHWSTHSVHSFTAWIPSILYCRWFSGISAASKQAPKVQVESLVPKAQRCVQLTDSFIEMLNQLCEGVVCVRVREVRGVVCVRVREVSVITGQMQGIVTACEPHTQCSSRSLLPSRTPTIDNPTINDPTINQPTNKPTRDQLLPMRRQPWPSSSRRQRVPSRARSSQCRCSLSGLRCAQCCFSPQQSFL